MSDSIVKCRKYVDHPQGRSKHTCLIRGPSHSSDECKVLVNFCFNYSKSRPTKDRWHDTTTINKLNRHQEKILIVNHALDEIILRVNNKVSAEAEAHEIIGFDIGENDLYHIDNMSIDKKMA